MRSMVAWGLLQGGFGRGFHSIVLYIAIRELANIHFISQLFPHIKEDRIQLNSI